MQNYLKNINKKAEEIPPVKKIKGGNKMKAICKEYIEEVNEADEPCCGPMNWALSHKDIEIRQQYYHENNYTLAFYLGEQEIECCPFCGKKIEKGG